MSELGSEKPRPWNIYSEGSRSQAVVGHEATWKNMGTSMNAICFGFIATAILISMFLLMAIFEHLFRPNSNDEMVTSPDPEAAQKLGNARSVTTPYASDFSVVMPGEQYPTYIAQPAPLPCPREGVSRPSHNHNFVIP